MRTRNRLKWMAFRCNTVNIRRYMHALISWVALPVAEKFRWLSKSSSECESFNAAQCISILLNGAQLLQSAAKKSLYDWWVSIALRALVMHSPICLGSLTHKAMRCAPPPLSLLRCSFHSLPYTIIVSQRD
jgi:hypothetical protein